METNTYRIMQRIFLLLFLTFFCINKVRSQNGVTLTWDSQVKCQVAIKDIKEPRPYDETIEEETPCIKFCQNTTTVFTLTTANQVITNVIWSATGGALSTNNGPTASMQWGDIGMGSISYTATYGIGPNQTTVTKTICVEKIPQPDVNFNFKPGFTNEEITVCKEQIINFQNLSTTNGGSSLFTYLWDFGDGQTSAAFEPSHFYVDPGNYEVNLWVTNLCGCTNRYTKYVNVTDKTSFEISCPGLVCEGEKARYTVPDEVNEICGGNLQWNVIGGHIVNQNGVEVEILWDTVDETGFGNLEVETSNCSYECPVTSMVKVPVIKNQGTIFGNQTLCIGDQGRYHIPQWPSTEVTWSVIGTSATIVAAPTDQRNEMVLIANQPGQVTLVANYTNTIKKCQGVALLVIDIFPEAPIVGPTKVCENSSAIFTMPAPVNWTVTNSFGTTVQTGTNQSLFTFNATPVIGPYTITTTDGGFCSSVHSFEVVRRLPTPKPFKGPNKICPGVTYTYTTSSFPPTPLPAGALYDWNVTGGTILGANNNETVNIVFDQSPNHTVSLSFLSTNPENCGSAVPRLMNITNEEITATLIGSNQACANSSQSYSISHNGDNVVWSINPSTAGSIISGQNTGTIQVQWNNTTSATQATVIAQVKKCTLSQPFVINVTLTPIPSFSLTSSITTTPASICAGEPVTFTLSPNLNSFTQIVWMLNGNPIIGASGSSYTTSFSNFTGTNITQIISAQVIGPNGCMTNSNIASFNLVVKPQPTISVQSNGNTLCPSSGITSIMLTANYPTNISIQWEYDNGSGFSPIIGATSANYNCTVAGFYRVSTINSDCKTISQALQIIEFCIPPSSCTPPSPSPTVYFTNSNVNCNVITVNAGASSGFASVDWKIFGPNGQIFAPVIQPSGFSLTVNAEFAGTYTVFFTATYTCTDGTPYPITTSQTFAINAIPNFEYSYNCTTNQFQFINTSSVTAGTYSYEYFVSTNPGAPSPIWTPIGLNNTGNLTYSDPNSSFNTLGFKLVINGISNCAKTVIVDKGLLSNQYYIVQNNVPQCLAEAFEFSFSQNIPNASYLWSFGDGSTSILSNPSKTFTTAGPINISVTVTNIWGCSQTYHLNNVIVPPSCFIGSIIATPSATGCSGNSITLTYQSNNDNCSATNYTWMKDDFVIAQNQISYTATTPGSYWVKVTNGNTTCDKISNVIAPQFIKSPSIKIKAENIICQGDNLPVTVYTPNATISWSLSFNGIPVPSFGNPTSIGSTFSVDQSYLTQSGTYILSATVNTNTNPNCSASASHTFEVSAPLIAPSLQYTLLNCNPYTAEITISNPASGVYNWSNGATSNSSTGYTILVNHGGPYNVTLSAGSCLATSTTINLPKSPEEYIWVFPTGCISACTKMEDNLPYMVGPTVSLDYWDWNENGNILNGNYSYMPNYYFDHDGEYNASIDTYASASNCSLTSEKMYFTASDEECIQTECEFTLDKIFLHKIEQVQYSPCVFTAYIHIENFGPPQYLTLNSLDPNVTLLLAGNNLLQPGGNDIPVIIQFASGFNGGISIDINFIAHSLESNLDCLRKFSFDMPECTEISNCETELQELYIGVYDQDPSANCQLQGQFDVGYSYEPNTVEVISFTCSNPNVVITPITPAFIYSNSSPISIYFNVVYLNGYLGGNTNQVTIVTRDIVTGEICSITIDGYFGNCTVGYNKMKNQDNKFSITPNPTNGNVALNYTLSNNDSVLTIYDIAGRKVYDSMLDTESHQLKIDLTSLPSGVYVARVTEQNQLIYVEKIIKN